MNKERSLKYWKINQENKANKRVIADWARRKEFNKACKEKNCFGRIEKGAEPEKMTSEEYDVWIQQFPTAKLRL